MGVIVVCPVDRFCQQRRVGNHEAALSYNHTRDSVCGESVTVRNGSPESMSVCSDRLERHRKSEARNRYCCIAVQGRARQTN